MLQRARLIGGLVLGWCLVHGLHAGALMLVPALLPLCGGTAAGASVLDALAPAIRALGTLASFGTQALVLLALPVLAAAWRRWRSTASRRSASAAS
ncbi:MAG: hypothetical protein V4792_12760 [Pseudomonadota bacterium]